MNDTEKKDAIARRYYASRAEWAQLCIEAAQHLKSYMQIEMNTSLRTPAQAPKLADLAAACHNGACNVGGLLRGVSEAAAELPAGEAKDHPAVKLILGQISFLCRESMGPTSEAIREYEVWRDQQPATK